MKRQQLNDSGRWVIKIGSAVLTNDGLGLDQSRIEDWVKDISILRENGHQVVLVSSGAVAEGLVRLGWNNRPSTVHELQAAAAVGQTGLVQAYETEFAKYGIRTAQILLTADDLSDRQRYLNARSAIQSLIQLGVIPIVNENDTVGTEEIRFGDNDTLAGLVCNLVEADRLLILTDRQGLYDSDPRSNTDAKLVSEGRAGDPALESMAGSSSGKLGRGGMTTKLRAAALAARSGTCCLIASGREQGIISRISQGEQLGTLLTAGENPVGARKQWLAGQLQVQGQLVLDDGAVKVLSKSGRSLLPIGVAEIRGNFVRGDLVSCVDQLGRELARGLVNYNSDESSRIIGKASSEIAEILGYCDDEELIHRNNLVLMEV
ncbi:MAG: glutamate 5-kinase [Porticoccaceae bacterium]|nr:glutamate 5-kinase [Porticoccaceae bacterium]